MKTFAVVLTFATIVALSANAQDAKPAFHLWNDTFGGNQGATLYPQYGWSVPTRAGSFSGYGFVEVAPHEQLFTNHLLVFTPKPAAWFSVHAETGGVPRLGLGFHQIGPRINAAEAVPKLKKPLQYLFVAALPRFIGIRPNNLLLAGGTNKFKVARGLQASIEGYRRFFRHGGDYAEYWLLVHPKATPRLSFGSFILHDGEKLSFNFGMRVTGF